MIIDVPMYLSRWRAGLADGSKLLGPLEGLRDVSTRWVVTHDIAHWKDEIAWMSLYFSAAVWASLALCVLYSLEDHLPRYRTEAAIASPSSEAFAVARAFSSEVDTGSREENASKQEREPPFRFNRNGKGSGRPVQRKFDLHRFRSS
jgi:hypothetical protein